MNTNDYMIAVLLSGIFVMTGIIFYLVVAMSNHIKRIDNRVSLIFSDLRAIKAEAERRYIDRG